MGAEWPKAPPEMPLVRGGAKVGSCLAEAAVPTADRLLSELAPDSELRMLLVPQGAGKLPSVRDSGSELGTGTVGSDRPTPAPANPDSRNTRRRSCNGSPQGEPPEPETLPSGLVPSEGVEGS